MAAPNAEFARRPFRAAVIVFAYDRYLVRPGRSGTWPE
jgi:hypothetical protein